METTAEIHPVKSAGRILDLLELFAARDTSLSLHEVATALGIPKSSTLMLIQTLILKGYAIRGADERYRLDPLYRLSGQHWVGGSIGVVRRTARPEMEVLAAEIAETVLLGVLRDDLQVQVVDKVVSPRMVRYDVALHSTFPAYATALGRATLAFSPAEVIDSYLATVPMMKLARNTMTDQAALRADLSQVRSKGYAVNYEESLDGTCSISAPLLDAAGHAIGGLVVGCVTASFDQKQATITRSLLEKAAIVNDRLTAIDRTTG